MPRTSSIPPNLEREVLERAGEGMNTQQIAAWLKSERGIETSRYAVARLIGRGKAERAEIAQAVVKEKLAASVTADLDVLGELQARLKAVADRLLDEVESNPHDTIGAGVQGGGGTPTVTVACNAIREVRALAEKRLELSGANQQPTDGGISEDDAAVDDLFREKFGSAPQRLKD